MTKTKNKILIADDEPALLSLMQTLLSPHFEVVVAKNGDEAQKYIENEEFLFLILVLMTVHIRFALPTN